jgi:hypothetical protein
VRLDIRSSRSDMLASMCGLDMVETVSVVTISKGYFSELPFDSSYFLFPLSARSLRQWPPRAVYPESSGELSDASLFAYAMNSPRRQ